MNGYLLDACALIALLNDENGADKVESLLNGSEPVLMSAINMLEVAYDAVRRSGGNTDAASLCLQLAQNEGIEVLWALSEPDWLAAARWKARGRLSLADAIALAVSETRKLKLVSADHHELDVLVSAGLVDVEWIR
ncbi:MAG: PIN domain-containing protein [Methylomonas sp.]|jgi:PIN domain nuclease of toxin-antitoxin system